MSDSWTFVCAISELLPGEMKTAWDEVTSVPIVVFNLDGMYYALEDKCSHEDFELSAGGVDPDTGSIECVLHGARFDIPVRPRLFWRSQVPGKAGTRRYLDPRRPRMT